VQPFSQLTFSHILPCVTAAESQHPHPAAPSELKKSFSEFVKKFEASSSSSLLDSEVKGGRSKEAFTEFWEAPARFWKPTIRELEEREIEAILSGGASSH